MTFMPLDSVLSRKYFVMNRITIQKKFYPVVTLRSKLDSSTEIKKSFEFFAETFLFLKFIYSEKATKS